MNRLIDGRAFSHKVLHGRGYMKKSTAVLIALLVTGGMTVEAKEDIYSHELFFSANFYHTVNRDNTLANYDTEEYEKDVLGETDRRGEGFIYRYGKFFGGNGIVLENVEFHDTVSFAAKIQPKEEPKVEAKKPEAPEIKIGAPEVKEPEGKTIGVEWEEVTEPVLEEKKFPPLRSQPLSCRANYMRRRT